MSQSSVPFEGADVWMKMWSDMMTNVASATMKAASGASAPASPPPPDPARQMRDAFFDAWSKYCDEFMRSEPFLQMMRQSMQNSLAFRQQVNQFLSRSLSNAQMPNRSDTEDILRMLHSVEDRVLDRLDDLVRRVELLERSAAAPPAPPASPRPTPGPASTGRAATKGASR